MDDDVAGIEIIHQFMVDDYDDVILIMLIQLLEIDVLLQHMVVDEVALFELIIVLVLVLDELDVKV